MTGSARTFKVRAGRFIGSQRSVSISVFSSETKYFENREWGGCGGGEGGCRVQSEFRVADLEKMTFMVRDEKSDETGSKSDPPNRSKSSPILE